MKVKRYIKINETLQEHYFILCDFTQIMMQKFIIDDRVEVTHEAFNKVIPSYKYIENAIRIGTLNTEDDKFLKCSIVNAFMSASFLFEISCSEGVEVNNPLSNIANRNRHNI